MPKPFPDTSNARKALELKKKGLTIYQIGKLMNVDRKTAWRWIQYFERGKLSTVDR